MSRHVRRKQFRDGGTESKALVHAVGELLDAASPERHQSVMLKGGMDQAERLAVEGDLAGLVARGLNSEELVRAFDGDLDRPALDPRADAKPWIKRVPRRYTEGAGAAQGVTGRSNQRLRRGFDLRESRAGRDPDGQGTGEGRGARPNVVKDWIHGANIN